MNRIYYRHACVSTYDHILVGANTLIRRTTLHKRNQTTNQSINNQTIEEKCFTKPQRKMLNLQFNNPTTTPFHAHFMHPHHIPQINLHKN